jgi:tetratricopeptide (TPR) repeat protein
LRPGRSPSRRGSPARRSPRALPPALAAALLLQACAQIQSYQPFDSTAHLRDRYVAIAGPELGAKTEVPYDLDAEILAVVDDRIGRAGSEEWKVEQVVDFIFNWLDLDYTQSPTRSGAEAYRSRSGNCLSFVNLFVGVGRRVGLNPFYVEVKDYHRWNYREGMVVSHGHIVSGMYVNGDLRTFDFLPYRPKSYRDFAPIDDVKATAHFYNNLGAEALLAGDVELALERFELAVALAPDFVKALNNLGVALQRQGRTAEALEALRAGLERDPEDVPLLTNLARAHQLLGEPELAEGYLSRIEGLEHTNPFFFIYRGELALHQGDLQTALDYMVKAFRRDGGLPEVHLGLVKVYLALADMERVRHHLERALQLDATNQEARKYALMIFGPEGEEDTK